MTVELLHGAVEKGEPLDQWALLDVLGIDQPPPGILA